MWKTINKSTSKGFFIQLNRNTPHSLLILIIFLSALLTRFLFFGWPAASIIDEIYFGNYLSSYFTHKYYFDVHPPLGKLIVAGFASFFGFDPILPGTHWKQEYTDNNYLILRFVPGIFGALLPVIIYLLAHQWWRDRCLAFFVALLIVFENALISQSRFLFWDSFLLCFGFAAVLFYSYYRETSKTRYLLLTGLCAGAAFSNKWTGATFIALPILLDAIWWLRKRISLVLLIRHVSIVLSMALLVYVAVFYIHFKLLPLSGAGDKHMTKQFQVGLIGNKYSGDTVQPTMNFIEQFAEVNQEMFRANQHMSKHPASSHWYQWPLGEKSLGYWRKGKVDIALQANLVVWYLASLAMLALTSVFIVRPTHWRDESIIAIVLGMLMNWLPFALISRAMFIHSYLMALVFTILALGWILKTTPVLKHYYGWLLIPVFIGYLAMAHLTYGLPPVFSSWN